MQSFFVLLERKSAIVTKQRDVRNLASAETGLSSQGCNGHFFGRFAEDDCVKSVAFGGEANILS